MPDDTVTTDTEGAHNPIHMGNDALQECVDKKIPILLKEGYEEKQAQAIAYSICRKKLGMSQKKSEKKEHCKKCGGIKKAQRKDKYDIILERVKKLTSRFNSYRFNFLKAKMDYKRYGNPQHFADVLEFMFNTYISISIEDVKHLRSEVNLSSGIIGQLNKLSAGTLITIKGLKEGESPDKIDKKIGGLTKLAVIVDQKLDDLHKKVMMSFNKLRQQQRLGS